VVKSHGGTDARGFASALQVTANLARSDFSKEVRRNFERLRTVLPVTVPEFEDQ